MNEHELADIAAVLRPEQRQLAQSARRRGKEGRCLVEAAEAGEEGPAGERDEDEERDQRKDRLPPMHHGAGDLRGEGASGHDPDDGSGGIAGGIRQFPVKSSHGDDGSGCQRPERPRQREAQPLEHGLRPRSPRQNREGPGPRVMLPSLLNIPGRPAPRPARFDAVESIRKPLPRLHSESGTGTGDCPAHSDQACRVRIDAAPTSRSFRGS